jgi:hypothetical protein
MLDVTFFNGDEPGQRAPSSCVHDRSYHQAGACMYSPRDPINAKDFIRQVEQDREMKRRLLRHPIVTKAEQFVRWIVRRNRKSL